MVVRGGGWAWLGGLVLRAWHWILRWFVGGIPAESAARERLVALPAVALEHVTAAGPALIAREPRIADADPLPDAAAELPYGDFADAAEADRFAALPPIAPDATDDVDWDALARELTRRS